VTTEVRTPAALTTRAMPQLVSANWKMHENHFEALQYVQRLAAMLRATPLPERREISLHPPFTSLRTVQTALESDAVPVALGAQNCHDEARGAFTGEISAEMLAKLGVRYVICGHSERRQLFGETDELIGRKLRAIWGNGLVPILCVGDTAGERADGIAVSRVASQLEAALGRDPTGAGSSLVVAYEPIWAIGTGATATVEDAAAMCGEIRRVVAELGSLDGAAMASLRVQYGGSVNPGNASALLSCDEIDGVLVGGASLDPEQLEAIARAGS
jgi:triosephosphate isomerase